MTIAMFRAASFDLALAPGGCVGGEALFDALEFCCAMVRSISRGGGFVLRWPGFLRPPARVIE
jgi:hypothetical protein